MFRVLYDPSAIRLHDNPNQNKLFGEIRFCVVRLYFLIRVALCTNLLQKYPLREIRMNLIDGIRNVMRDVQGEFDRYLAIVDIVMCFKNNQREKCIHKWGQIIEFIIEVKSYSRGCWFTSPARWPDALNPIAECLMWYATVWQVTSSSWSQTPLLFMTYHLGQTRLLIIDPYRCSFTVMVWLKWFLRYIDGWRHQVKIVKNSAFLGMLWMIYLMCIDIVIFICLYLWR